MNRLNKLFETRKNLLSIYFTAGFPNLNDTLVILQALQDSGVDFMEIGMPFSDPLADGPVIQASSTAALNNGMSLNLLFEQLQTVRQTISMPLVLMGYLNPVLKFGVEKFIQKCSEIGVDGVILPDLPFELFNREYRSMFESKGISNIFLITPQTPECRLRMLDEASTGFLYMVSSAAVTGAKSGISQSQIDYFERVNALNLNSPRMVGFGISDNESFKQVCKYANGAIIGSAFIRMIEKSSDIPGDTARFINAIRGGK
ncbi:tryptophan synthase subunit alpha [Alkaliflexus imshenetskii]|uniref:tryptophan synthase subunit alpha n=1 Tax=Alkaliflexus imshenetskii TaxID=286730 RepID=UPI00047DA818|nr:tryptophan synthase subunit alpha [Alkaliflexus imshenetskii]